MIPSTLIYGSCFVQDEEHRELVKLWARHVNYLNPGVDVLVIDSCSPFDPARFLPKYDTFKHYRFPDNVGHLSRGGKDGAGRAFCEGVNYAINHGYQYCIHFETDFLLNQSVVPLVERCWRGGVKVTALAQNQYQFPEWAFSIMDVPYLYSRNFIAQYDWPRTKGDVRPIPEIWLEQIFKDDLFFLPLYGIRNDQHQINVGNFHGAWPYKTPDWITHCRDFDVYLKFLHVNGIILPDEGGNDGTKQWSYVA